MHFYFFQEKWLGIDDMPVCNFLLNNSIPGPGTKLAVKP